MYINLHKYAKENGQKVIYSHLSPSHLLLSMGTNSLDLLTILTCLPHTYY